MLHDVGTPPFPHTAEYVLDGFDHEDEAARLLCEARGDDFHPDMPIFASQLPRFRQVCESASSKLKIDIDPDEVARMVVGDGDLGFLIQGTVDLDNADNVTRACMYLGHQVDGTVPFRIAAWLARQAHAPARSTMPMRPAVTRGLATANDCTGVLGDDQDEELGRQAGLQHLMRRAIDEGLPRSALIWKTDESLLAAIETLPTASATPDEILTA